MRGKAIMRYASHYADDNVFGHRAKMRIPSRSDFNYDNRNVVAILEIGSLRRQDAGVYKCRADFKKSPTKNNKFMLSVQGK